MKAHIAFTLAVAAVFLSGCMAGVAPFPHTTLATPKVQARVLDSATQQPVTGAFVRVPERPQISAASSESGCITLKPTRNFHWLYLWAGGDQWDEPFGFRWSRQLEFTHTNYDSRLVTLTLPYSPRNWSATNMGDISLERRRE